MAGHEREWMVRLADDMRVTIEQAPHMSEAARLDWLWKKAGDWYSIVATLVAEGEAE